MMQPTEARAQVTRYIADKRFADTTMPALSVLIADVDRQVMNYGSLAQVPAAAVSNIRNDMYLASEAIKRLGKEKAAGLSEAKMTALTTYKGSLDAGTRFIPTWGKIAGAFALGLGTMVGWRRIVVTVGEKIGKTHLTYAQGASAARTIWACRFRPPMSCRRAWPARWRPMDRVCRWRRYATC